MNPEPYKLYVQSSPGSGMFAIDRLANPVPGYTEVTPEQASALAQEHFQIMSSAQQRRLSGENITSGLNGLGDPNEFLNKTSQLIKNPGESYYSNYTDPNTGEALKNVSQSTVNQLLQYQAGVAAGTLKKVPIGSGFGYIPTGSAAANLNQGIQSGQVSPTNPTQQYNASQTGNNVNAPNINAINPSMPTAPIDTPQSAPNGVQQQNITPTAGQPTVTQAQGQTYVVKAGDTLTKIAKQLGVKVSDISGYKSGNPNIIRTGETLTVGQQPAPAAGPVVQDVSSVLPSYGVDVDSSAAQTAFQVQPERSFEELYKDIASSLNLPTLKSTIDSANEKLLKLRDEKTNEANEISNNPWISESLRLKKLANIDAKYDDKEKNLLSSIEIAQNQYDTARDEAKFIAQQTLLKYNTDRQFEEKQLEYLLTRADKALELDNKKPASAQEYEYAVSQGYKGSYNDYQNMDANRKRSVTNISTGGSGLTPGQINSTVNSITGAFDNEPLVKEYNTIKRNVDVYNNLGKSATDDIQRVYTFAKVADPNSAVKEGEYASIEKYAQALLQRQGLRVSRVFTSTGVLTDEARTAMGKTLNTNLSAAEKAYKNVESEYQRRINDAYAGKPAVLTNYAGTSTTPSKFDYLQKDITISGKNAYLPRSVWDTVKGADKDALLAEAKADGYTLLIK